MSVNLKGIKSIRIYSLRHFRGHVESRNDWLYIPLLARNIHVDSFNSSSKVLGIDLKCMLEAILTGMHHLGSEDSVLYRGFRESELYCTNSRKCQRIRYIKSRISGLYTISAAMQIPKASGLHSQQIKIFGFRDPCNGVKLSSWDKPLNSELRGHVCVLRKSARY